MSRSRRGARGRRRRPIPPPRTWSELAYIEIPREEIWYVKFILEAYENLAYFSVIDRHRAVLQLVFSRDGEQELHDLMQGLGLEIPLKRLQFNGRGRSGSAEEPPQDEEGLRRPLQACDNNWPE